MAHELWVPGAPRPKDRPRKGKYGNFYTPKTSLDAEEIIRNEWHDASLPMFEGPVWVQVYYWPHGQEITIGENDASFERTKGDLDNLVKLTLDGLQGAAFENDKQVVAIEAYKR